MAVKYICCDCAKLLKMTGFTAINEVGRKYCEWCGGNDDNLVCVDAEKCDKKIEDWKRKVGR